MNKMLAYWPHCVAIVGEAGKIEESTTFVVKIPIKLTCKLIFSKNLMNFENYENNQVLAHV